MIWDTFMGHDELDMLECRLTELQDVPNLTHVLVEADTDHQGHPKPYYFSEHAERFAAWSDRLIIIQATGLPDSPDAWDREHAQREHVARALTDADPDDVVLHGDIDEIPTTTFAANVKPRGFVTAGMSFHCFAVDWLHPGEWPGTVAGRARNISSFAKMRDSRLTGTPIPRSGWHLTWIGGHEASLTKTTRFCHPEVLTWAGAALERDDFYRHGYHVNGQRLEAVTVNGSWPRWIAEGHAPASWFRPTDVEREHIDIQAGRIVKGVRA